MYMQSLIQAKLGTAQQSLILKLYRPLKRSENRYCSAVPSSICCFEFGQFQQYLAVSVVLNLGRFVVIWAVF